ncbi:MAG: hypothetical protein IT378_22835 [Sandaracinaceae bacterium]|nr:hypothetical protein [Sandaracinaceae bacterium]MCC6877159.1 hypothetical protein [Sandaracinaceae bacterium]
MSTKYRWGLTALLLSVGCAGAAGVDAGVGDAAVDAGARDAAVDGGAVGTDAGPTALDAGDRADGGGCRRWTYDVLLYQDPCRACWVDQCGALIGDERVRTMSFCAFCPFAEVGGDPSSSCACVALPACSDLGDGYLPFYECLATECRSQCGIRDL